MSKKGNPRRKKPLLEEIRDTEAKDQYESVSQTISIRRSLYLHILQAMRDGDYNSPSAYISALIRADKHVPPQPFPAKFSRKPDDQNTEERGPEH